MIQVQSEKAESRNKRRKSEMSEEKERNERLITERARKPKANSLELEKPRMTSNRRQQLRHHEFHLADVGVLCDRDCSSTPRHDGGKNAAQL